MYPLLLSAHSWLRWAVVVLGIWTFASAALSMVASTLTGEPTRSPSKVAPGLLFTIAIDLQLVLGLLLYFVSSPVTAQALSDMAGAMQNAPWRYWVAEHPTMMVLAVVFAHVARIVGRKPGSPRAALVWSGLALLALLIGTPWPFMPQGRPFFRI
jgi:hypothetical protein